MLLADDVIDMLLNDNQGFNGASTRGICKHAILHKCAEAALEGQCVYHAAAKT